MLAAFLVDFLQHNHIGDGLRARPPHQLEASVDILTRHSTGSGPTSDVVDS